MCELAMDVIASCTPVLIRCKPGPSIRAAMGVLQRVGLVGLSKNLNDNLLSHPKLEDDGHLVTYDSEPGANANCRRPPLCFRL